MYKNIKVGFLTPDLSNGGAEKALYNLASFFYNRKVQIQIIAGRAEGANAGKLPKDLQVFSLKNDSALDSPSFFKNIKGIVKYAAAEKPDVLICNSDYLNIAAIIARLFVKNKFKIIISQQFHAGEFIKTLPWKNRLMLGAIQKIISQKADVIVGASKGVAQNFAQLYKIKNPSDKTRSIYNPIYEDAIPELASQKVEDADFAPDTINLITVGRLLEQKDHTTLINAFNLVLSTISNVHLFIIGVGKDQKVLEKLSEKLGISNKITFLGYKENPFSYVAKCDLFVLSSAYEGFGNVVVEALATGVNVVSTDCPSGPAEILNYGEFGYLCPVANPKLLSDAIITALQNKKPANVLINRAKEFSIANTGQQYLDTVYELVA
jgi:glycosyltransferase involved in cell wall biosynthesis